MKCYVQKPSEVQRKWHLIDAEGKTLGRLSTEIAKLLRGKHKVTFTPHVDGGDYVVIINAEKIEVTGKKRDNKVYRHHTGYIGNLKEINFKKLQEKNPEEIIRLSVRGMLPKNKLRAPMMKRLRIFAGSEHIHQAQNVEKYEF
ncbi:MAG: 50S ribosomal protein L13 [Peptostreptococcaceae bacterium]|nr:50S ribosomal protein L13 [Peptostreptococcaceae bacterium]